MKGYLSIPDWTEFQHYKDRSPPWIKLHNQLLENYEFECLPDASKAHLLCIWLLASRTNNKINPDPKWIGRRIGANSEIDIDLLVSSGFLVFNQGLREVEHVASTSLQEVEHVACPEREGEESKKEEEREDKNPLPVKPDNPVMEIFDFWRDVMKKGSTTKPIASRINAVKARLKDGYSVDEIKQAITNCSLSEFHMGKNDGGTLYNDLSLICRASKFESFRDSIGKGPGIQGAGIGKGNDRDYDKVDYQSGATREEDYPEWMKNGK